MITVSSRPQGIDWCRQPMPFILNSNRKTVAVAAKASFRLRITNPGFTVNKFITIKYGNVELTMNGVASPTTDSGTQYSSGAVSTAIAYFQRNYFLDRDFVITLSTGTGFNDIVFTAKYDGAEYNADVTTDDTNVTFTSLVTGVTATPNPNFAYLIDVYLQKVNSDTPTDEPYIKLPSIALAPNTGTSELDVACELLPYTKPEPPILGSSSWEDATYLRKQALRYYLRWAEAYGTNFTPQVSERLIGGVTGINANVAIRGGVRKNILPWVYEQGNVNVGGGTANTWAEDKIWLTNYNEPRRVSERQPNWLTILAKGSINDAKVNVRYYDTPTHYNEFFITTLTWPVGRPNDDVLPLRIPVGLSKLLQIAGSPGYPFYRYDVVIYDENDNLLYGPVRFNVEPEHYYERVLIFENSLGGWESLRLIGGKVNFAIVEGEQYTKLNELFADNKHTPETGNYASAFTEEIELNSGPLKSIQEVYWYVEMLISECIYLYNFYDEHNEYFRVTRVPDTFQLMQDDNNHFYINLKVRKAFKDEAFGYLPIY